MPRKIRQLKGDLRRAGFTWRPGKDDHTVWRNDLVPETIVTLDGQDGDDAKRYQERDVREALAALQGAEARQAQEQ